MTFEEKSVEQWCDRHLGHTYLSQSDVNRLVNIVLEEAAKVADKNATPEKHMAAYLAHQKDAEDIRSLKEE